MQILGVSTNDSSPLTSNPVNRAAKAYQSGGSSGLSSQDLMAEVIRKVINYVHLAGAAYQNRTLDIMADYNNKAIKIIDVLREELAASDALKDPEAKPAALFLLKTYADVMLRLANILRTPAPAEEFTAIETLLAPIYAAWKPIAPTAAEADATTPTGSAA